MAWTTEQQKAIDFRGGNLLVSAAAGSGKTAVLVERIIQRITDPVSPLGIDDIVVVTFTKAAAEEMKSRLGRAFEKEVIANPENRHLIKQLSLLDSARICTIDSFCSYVVRNYYNSIGIDPSFRIADEGEMNLMMSDVMDAVIEKHLSEGDEAFEDFAEAFAGGKNMDRIYEIVTGLYRFAQSNPWPLEWLDGCMDAYNILSQEEYEKLPLVQKTVRYIISSAEECMEEYRIMLDCCMEPSGPAKYADRLNEEMESLRKITECSTLAQLEAASDIEFKRLPPVKDADDELKESVQAARKSIKKRISNIREKYLAGSRTQHLRMGECRKYAKVITELAKEFTVEYGKAKTDRNIADFSDIEHYALDILVTRNGGEIGYTEVADELAEQYEEIYIDEYQDSNLVQECILKAVSRERFGQPDMFMVGDVKQSIYKFRMAKPELFMEKYDSYADEGKYVRIELHKNFRSRANVLDTVNDVFYMAMKKCVGGVEYTEDVSLNCGLEPSYDREDVTEVMLADKAEFEDADTTDIYCNMAAYKIRQLMAEDASLRFRDIVILLRNDKKDAPKYAEVLRAQEIPCVYSRTTGYFDSYEVSNVMDLLRVIDNPRQEIPLAGVMRSYFAYFAAEEMALIKGRKRKTQLYDCLIEYGKRNDALSGKCRELLSFIEKYRERSKTETINELISDIIYNSGYYDYIGAMSGGNARKANLDMLVQKARQYEKTSYSGLFNFLRYIEKLRKYEVDYGEAQCESEEDDVVRIMSIHKSKGLEFPVVIIGNMGKEYNIEDTKRTIIYDSDYGIGMTDVDLKYRIRRDTAYRNMLAVKIMSDNIGEELRVLYVAMTRAIDRLIMLGVTKTEQNMHRWKITSRTGHMDMNYIMENRSYIDIVMPAALKADSKGRFRVTVIAPDELMESAAKPVLRQTSRLLDAISDISGAETDKAEYEKVCAILDYSYPHSDISALRAKYSVSELKHKDSEENRFMEAQITGEERTKLVPSFIETKEQNGISYGNAYHKVFELLDYDSADSLDGMAAQLERLKRDGRLSEEYGKLIDCEKFVRFVKTPLGQMMKEAFRQKLLFREQPFTMEVDASKIDCRYPSEEKVLVQGIIDAFFFREDKVYLVDYKTDRVPRGSAGENMLTERYKKQLELYCDALCKITGRKMGGCFIYSVSLNKEIALDFPEI